MAGLGRRGPEAGLCGREGARRRASAGFSPRKWPRVGGGTARPPGQALTLTSSSKTKSQSREKPLIRALHLPPGARAAGIEAEGGAGPSRRRRRPPRQQPAYPPAGRGAGRGVRRARETHRRAASARSGRRRRRVSVRACSCARALAFPKWG